MVRSEYLRLAAGMFSLDTKGFKECGLSTPP